MLSGRDWGCGDESLRGNVMVGHGSLLCLPWVPSGSLKAGRSESRPEPLFDRLMCLHLVRYAVVSVVHRQPHCVIVTPPPQR